MMLVQRLKKENTDKYEVAESYYSLLSSLNELGMTKREIQLAAHCSINGNISHTHIKEEFCTKYGTSVQTINNMISRLKKINVFVKDGGKIKMHPSIALKFDGGIVLQIVLLNGQAN